MKSSFQYLLILLSYHLPVAFRYKWRLLLVKLPEKLLTLEAACLLHSMECVRYAVPLLGLLGFSARRRKST